jgi:NAD-dependent deacetylase sirtuin 5
MSADLSSFQQYLASSRRILALGRLPFFEYSFPSNKIVGAGLSASSGLPTFRGAGGYWRGYDATELATPEAFQADPSLVWQFYSFRRSAALKAKPNNGHYALAELARRRKNRFLMLTQNVDGLSARAHHPPEALLHLHGDLFTLKCTSFMCSFTEENNLDDPLTPALSNCDESLSKRIPANELPLCPSCRTGLLRPGVVWFGEPLPLSVINKADDFITSGEVDLILVVGTSGSVWPAAGYVEQVVMQGGKVAVFNTEPPEGVDFDGWVFTGDAAEWLPKALEPIIGKVRRR